MAKRRNHDRPTPARVRAFFSYVKKTGVLRWKRDKGTARKGDIAGSDNGKDYLHVGFDGANYAVHVLAFVIVEGRWPRERYMIDHRDHDGMNNRWRNLREVTRKQNGANRRGPNRNSTTGFRGVYPAPGGGFRAFLTISAGRHPTAEAAARAIARLRQRHHGEYAGARNA